MARIDQLLEIVKSARVTDLHLAGDSVPMIRVGGQLEKTRHRLLSEEDVRVLLYEILTDRQIRTFEKTGDIDLAYAIDGLGRFRMNIYRTQSGISAAIKLVPDPPPDLETLGFSKAVMSLARSQSGLVLITGPANSGKSTTLAAMIDYINTNFARHIIILENPLEYIHSNKNSLVSQRQIGLHVQTYSDALRAAVQEDPDVILIGELPDSTTIQQTLTAAENGITVIGTLPTLTAMASIDRIINAFPPDQKHRIQVMLAACLRGIVSQQLLPRQDASGPVLVYELMFATSSIAALIRGGKLDQITARMKSTSDHEMQLFDDHLRVLVDAGQLSVEQAIGAAIDPAPFITATFEKETAEAGC